LIAGASSAYPEFADLGFLNVFSGHGLQQGPVVGRAKVELILRGRFCTLDLSDLGYERLLRGRPIHEKNVNG
jgi:glycine/D-amino acid oxidase-like deaminating enzyme